MGDGRLSLGAEHERVAKKETRHFTTVNESMIRYECLITNV